MEHPLVEIWVHPDGLGDHLRDSPRVAQPVGRLEVLEVGDGPQYRFEISIREAHPVGRLHRDHPSHV